MNYQITRIGDGNLRRSFINTTTRTSSSLSSSSIVCRRPLRRELSINRYYFNDNNNSNNSLSIEHSYNPLGNNETTRSYSSITTTTTGPNQKLTEIEIIDDDEHRKFNFKAKFESNPLNSIEIPIQIHRRPAIKIDETHEKSIVNGKNSELIRRTRYEYSYDSTKSTSTLPKVVTLQMPLYITETIDY
jgi:hypothetical protein